MALAAILILLAISQLQSNASAFHSATSEDTSAISVGSLSDFTFNAESVCKGNESRCPPWSYCDELDGTCKCLNSSNDVFKCDSVKNSSYILSCYCATYDAVTDITVVGVCLYNCDFMGKNEYDIDVDYGLVPDNVSELNKAMCGSYQRTGILCGRCMNGTYLRTYSYDMSCIKCGNSVLNWLKYIVVAYVPLTIFFFIVIIFRINIPSSQVHGFVLFSQILSSPIFARTILFYLREGKNTLPYKFMQLFGTLYGIWNLDFFRLLDINICFEVSPLTTLSLDFFVAVYPLVLVVLAYITTLAHDRDFRPVVLLLKPFKTLFSLFRSNLDIRTSSVDAFATFMFLSNVKLLCVCFDLLAPVQVCDVSRRNSCHWAVFYDATVPYFSHQHIPYAVSALLVLFVFVMLPILIGITYSSKMFHKYKSLIPWRWQIGLHVFIDSFQGCYKDGTEPGCRDCRWFSSMTFGVRFLIFGVYSAVILSTFLPYCIMILTLTTCAVILVDPYKRQFQHFTKHQVIFLLFLACTITCAQGLDYNGSVITEFYVVVIVIGVIHLVYMCMLIVMWIVRQSKFLLKCKHHVTTRAQYNVLL